VAGARTLYHIGKVVLDRCMELRSKMRDKKAFRMWVALDCTAKRGIRLVGIEVCFNGTATALVEEFPDGKLAS
jgi:hypothetical protein